MRSGRRASGAGGRRRQRSTGTRVSSAGPSSASVTRTHSGTRRVEVATESIPTA